MEYVQPRQLHTAVGPQGVNALPGPTSNGTDRLTAATKIPHWSPSLQEVSPVNNKIGLRFRSRGKCVCLTIFTVTDVPRHSIQRPATHSTREALTTHPFIPVPLPTTTPASHNKRPISSQRSMVSSIGSSADFDVEAKALITATSEWKPTKKEMLAHHST